MTQSTRSPGGTGPSCAFRRRFLILGGASAGLIATLGPSEAVAQGAALVGSRYPVRVIGKLSAMSVDQPAEFNYPTKDVTNVLVRLGERAAGGVGPAQDVVAFNTLCPHMGGPVGADTYKATYKVLGPCPLHLSTFDLTRHGIIVSGHATESLPQVTLELRGDDIVAVGMMGLVYGYAANPRA